MRVHAFDNDLDQGRELMSILADELLPLVLADTVVNLDAPLLEEVPAMMARPVFAALSGGGSGSVNWQSLFRNLELLGRRLGWDGLIDGIGLHGHTSDEHACDTIWQKIFTA